MSATDDLVDLIAQANARGPTSGFTDVDDDAEQLPAGFNLKNAKVFERLKVGELTLQHRVVHAALGRSRTANATESPLAVKYYEQRTTPGALMISQATGTTLEHMAWPWVLHLETEEQKTAIARVIQAVHQKGGYWFQQLNHGGRCSSPGLVKHARKRLGLKEPPSYGYRSVSSSAVAETGVNTHSGEPFGVPHALTVDEIKDIVADFKRTATLAVEAGADGIELLAGNGFLLDQFLHDNINHREDQYGGSIENRNRITLEVVDALAEVVGYQRLGVRLSPFSNFHETDGSQPLEQTLQLSRELIQRGVAYLHVAQGRISRNLDVAGNLARLVAKGIAPEDISLRPFQRLLKEVAPSNPEHTATVLIGNGGYTAASGVLAVEDGLADAISYGRRFISNPDLVQRLRLGQRFTHYDRSTFYTHGAQGYTTYGNFGDREQVASNFGPKNEPATEEMKGTSEIAMEKSDVSGYAQMNIADHTAKADNLPAKDDAKSLAKRVAVIGAGVSGLVTAAAFQRLGGFDLRIFERKSIPGGVWTYDTVSTSVPQFPAAEPTDIDAPLPRPDGTLPLDLPRSTRQRFLSSPVYESLEANIPYTVMGGTSELVLPAPADKNSVYLTAQEVADAVAKAAEKYEHIIQYSTTVEDVQKLPQGDGVRILLRRENADGRTDTWYEEDFDHVVVATGHNSVPRVPEIPGIKTFKGELQHSTTWRSGVDLKNKKILVVGSSESAIDLVLESLPYAKGDIYVSQRTPHPRHPNVFQRPGIQTVGTIDHFTEQEIHLNDGRVLSDVETVVFATGYFHSFPFLSNIRPPVGPGGYRVPGLYQHIFDIHNPNTVAFVGVINGSLTWSTWEKSAFLIALLWSGKIHLPSREVQETWEKDKLAEKGEVLFHIQDIPYERVLLFDDLNELAAEYLSQEDADDTLLRAFPFEFVIDLMAGRSAKLKKYGDLEDVDGRGIPGRTVVLDDAGLKVSTVSKSLATVVTAAA